MVMGILRARSSFRAICAQRGAGQCGALQWSADRASGGSGEALGGGLQGKRPGGVVRCGVRWRGVVWHGVVWVV